MSLGSPLAKEEKQHQHKTHDQDVQCPASCRENSLCQSTFVVHQDGTEECIARGVDAKMGEKPVSAVIAARGDAGLVVSSRRLLSAWSCLVSRRVRRFGWDLHGRRRARTVFHVGSRRVLWPFCLVSAFLLRVGRCWVQVDWQICVG